MANVMDTPLDAIRGNFQGKSRVSKIREISRTSLLNNQSDKGLNESDISLRQLKNSQPHAGGLFEKRGMPAQARIRHHSSANQKPCPFLRRSHYEPNESSFARAEHRTL